MFGLFKVEDGQMTLVVESESWKDVVDFIHAREAVLGVKHTKTVPNGWSFGQPLYFHIANETYCGKSI